MSNSETIKLNDRDFLFTCGAFSTKLNNKDTNAPNFFPISFGSIDQIVINDSIFNPFIDVDLTVKTPVSIFENTPLYNFQFHANNRNSIAFNIEPVDTSTLNSKYSDANKLRLFGTISESDVVASDSSLTQITYFKIIDANEARLHETKISNVQESVYSGATVGSNIANILDIATGIKTGNFNRGDLKLNFNYYFPINSSAYDAINFLLPYNIGTVNTLPTQNFLRYNTTTQLFDNIPVTDIFTKLDQADSNLETFLLADNDGTTVQELNTGASPEGPQPDFIASTNKINNLAYNNVSFNIANNDFVSIYVSNTTNPTNVNSFTYVDVETAINDFDKNIIKPMASHYGNDVRLNVDLDTSKINKQNYKVLTSVFDNTINVKVAKSQLYNAFIFQNMFLTFTTDGQPYREPGKFINIKKNLDKVNTGSAFERKIIGQWYVTEVKHIITGDGKYKNFFQCVKPFINK
jgi:hypothetical protein